VASRERALKLLGNGVEQEVVATALGVSPSYISQLLAEPEFASAVAELRLLNLEQASDRDSKYDALEDKLLARLNDTTDYMTKPREVAAVLLGLNKAVRRGVRPENAPQVKQNVVVLNFPTVIQNKFVVNESNQVIGVGTEGIDQLQDLTTITAKNLLLQAGRIPLSTTALQRTSEVLEHGYVRREEILEGAGS
jgi:hypothetical protein